MKPRQRPRYVIQASVAFILAGEQEHAAVKNVSQRGCQIITSAELRVGQYIQLDLRISGFRESVCIPMAVVRWRKSPAIGIEFLIFGPGSHHWLCQLPPDTAHG
jgi:hypothetical protein